MWTLLILLIFSSCATSNAISFDKASDAVFTDLTNAGIKGTLAIVAVNSESKDLGLQIIRMLETKLVRTRNLQILSRTQIEVAISEQEFGASGYVDDYSAQSLGHLLGAEYVLIGEITKPENSFFLNIQVLETETARLVYSYTFQIDRRELKKYENKIDRTERTRVLRF